MGASLLIGFIISLRHHFNISFQLCTQFPFGYTTDSTIIISHADILQIIQFTENTHLTEFANTCQEKETKIFSLRFQGTKEFPHFFSKFILQFRQMVTV